jgi:hypothetical protein
MKIKNLVTVFIVMVGSLLPATLEADIVNGSFEDGLSGWTQDPVDASEVTTLTSLGSVLPTHGDSFLFLSNGLGTEESSVTIYQKPIYIEPGAVALRLDVKCLTAQPTPAEWLEETLAFSFMSQFLFYCSTKNNYIWHKPGTFIKDVFYPLPAPVTSPGGATFTKQTHWYRFTFDVSELGGLTIHDGITVFNFENQGSGQFDSAVLIDNITLEFTPSFPPQANAGTDQMVFDTIAFDAAESIDPDGTIESYTWQLNHRGDEGYNRTAQGIAPTVSDLQPGFYDVILTVTDDDGYTGTDHMQFGAIGRKGDLNGDGDVDGDDLAEFAGLFGSPL